MARCCLITAHKRSLRRLCFYRCVSVHRGAVGIPACLAGHMTRQQYISRCTVDVSQLVWRQQTGNIKCMMGYVTWYTPPGWRGPPGWNARPGWRAPPDGEIPPGWRTPRDGEPPRDGELPPWDGETPPGWRPPWDGETPCPPRWRTPPQMENPLGWRTPPMENPPMENTPTPPTVNVRAVRILLECILVPYIYLSLSNAKKLITIPEIDKTMLKEMKYITYIRPELCRR